MANVWETQKIITAMQKADPAAWQFSYAFLSDFRTSQKTVAFDNQNMPEHISKRVQKIYS